MSKWYGKIGFGIPITIPHTGISTDSIVEKQYYGDILKNYRRWNSGDKVNDDLFIQNELSVVADEFAYMNVATMRYVEISGTKWNIDNVTIEHPRLRISLGSVYTGPLPGDRVEVDALWPVD